MPPTKKRRLDDSDAKPKATTASSEKISRRQARAAALQRAREAMAKDKKKIEAAKKKKAAGAAAVTSSSASKKSASPSKSSSTATKTSTTTKPPTKRRRISQAPASPAASKESKSPSSAAKSTKKQAKEEAMQRAKEWGASKAEQRAKKKAEATTPKTPVASYVRGSTSASKTKTSTASKKKSPSRKKVSSPAARPNPPLAQPVVPPQPAPPQPVPPQSVPPQQRPAMNPAAMNQTGNMNAAAMNQNMMAQMMMRNNMMPPMYANQYMHMARQGQQAFGAPGYSTGFGAPFAPYGFPAGMHLVNRMNNNNATPQLPNQAQSSNSAGGPMQKLQAPQSSSSTGNQSSPLPTPPVTAVPPPSTNSVTKATAIPDDDDDDIVPPPPSSKLEFQISQQVMENCAASLNNQPLPHNQPPPEAFTADNRNEDHEDDDEEEIIDENPIVVDDLDDILHTAAHFSRRRARMLLSSIIVGLLSSMLFMWDSQLDNVMKWLKGRNQEKTNTVPCFIDSYVDAGLPSSCSDDAGVACPVGGVCENGVLIDCSVEHYEVSESQDQCVLTSEANENIAALRALLEQLSIHHQCVSPSPSNEGEYSMPLFDYWDLKQEHPTIVMDLKLIGTEFKVAKAEGESYVVGLPDSYELQLPFSCMMGKFLKNVLASCGSIMVIAVYGFTDISWAFASTYPFTSIIALLVALAFKQRRSHQLFRSKLLRDIAHVRQMAYERLQDSPQQSHVVLHIRDDIAMSLHADSKAQRHYIIHEVWPRVVPDVEQDNRVRKSTKLMDLNGNGNKRPRDVWQWVAAVPSSFNTPRTMGTTTQ